MATDRAPEASYQAGWTAAFAVMRALLGMAEAEYARMGDRRGRDLVRALRENLTRLEKD